MLDGVEGGREGNVGVAVFIGGRVRNTGNVGVEQAVSVGVEFSTWAGCRVIGVAAEATPMTRGIARAASATAATRAGMRCFIVPPWVRTTSECLVASGDGSFTSRRSILDRSRSL
jgi:hypothetical protein